MPLSSVLVEEALEELLEATSYLEDKSPGLGEKFNLASVETVEMPLTFPEIGYRTKALPDKTLWLARILLQHYLQNRGRYFGNLCSSSLEASSWLLVKSVELNKP